MKKIFFASVLLLSISGAANAKLASFADLKKDVLYFSKIMGDTSQDCSFLASEESGALAMALNSERGPLYFMVPEASSVFLQEQLSSDGSFKKAYTISGGITGAVLGTIELTHADDAYDKVKISLGRVSKTCEREY